MRHNLADWKEAIPDAALLGTFRDAIKVTRSLGIHYIWIDSLCIIQDSKADWLHESFPMSDVYKNSVCTIAATAVDSDTVGCFRCRDPKLIYPGVSVCQKYLMTLWNSDWQLR